MSKIYVPPIKCQGIKTKLVPFIRQNVQWAGFGKWVEPFLGSGVVGFNIRAKRAYFSDSNPHIIKFYQGINRAEITPSIVRAYLVREGKLLSEKGKDYYYEVRNRFNEQQRPLDFLFLNRAGFNGMIRFNQKGKLNVPFNHKPNRFRLAFITKVVNQVSYVFDLCQMNDYEFIYQDFRETLAQVEAEDFVYCDPPYAGRYVDYYNGWSNKDEVDLLAWLADCNCKFILSTWHSNKYRKNTIIETLEEQHHLVTKEHYYHVGAKESNRNAMLETLALNYVPRRNVYEKPTQYRQVQLLETPETYNEKSIGEECKK